MSKITIWILNYNWIERLKKVLPSILNQNYENKEILIVDNWSTDGSIEFLKWFENIKIIENWKNLWYGAWKNILVKESTWEYIFMLDNDIELSDDELLNRIYEKFKNLKNKNIWLLSILVKDFDKDYLNSVWLYFNKLQRNIKFNDIYKTWVRQVPWYHWNQVFFKKQFFIDIWWFDEIYPFNIDDYDLSARSYNYWYTIFIDTDNYVIHNWVETRISPVSLWWKNQYYFSWFSRMIWKNYKIINILKWWIISWGWIITKWIIESMQTKSLLPFKWTLKSIYFFMRDFWKTLKVRKQIQKNRITKKDLFLNFNI